ncbi:hypothetical protein [Bartonella sp. AP9QHHD]|uniref:hypothetical protein n=1 Tax=Bartonella sp. AP9QHHD TaxID=3243507 RepID=UPI0035D10B21
MVKRRESCGEDMGRRGCQWRRNGWIVQCVKIGMWGMGNWGNGERWGKRVDGNE